jgi:hypothetical protein
MKKILSIIIILLSYNMLKAQTDDVGQVYDENAYGMTATERNYPYLFSEFFTKEDSTLVYCRNMIKNPNIFIESNESKNISGFKDKPFNLLTNEEKEQIIINAWHDKDNGLLNIVNRIAISDTSEDLKYIRTLSIMCLSVFNTEASKNTLLNLLKSDKQEISLTSALSLVQLGQTDIGFTYIEKYYYRNYTTNDQIISALMIVNTPRAIKLLTKLAEDKDPSYALDASAALSLLGYCDLAFKNMLKYKDSDIVFVRQMVAWCLAYYIGTPEAIKTIMNLKDDPYHFLEKDREKIRKIYKLKI